MGVRARHAKGPNWPRRWLLGVAVLGTVAAALWAARLTGYHACSPAETVLTRAPDTGVVRVVYRPVRDPAIEHPLAFRVKTGSSRDWLGLQVLDTTGTPTPSAAGTVTASCTPARPPSRCGDTPPPCRVAAPPPARPR